MANQIEKIMNFLRSPIFINRYVYIDLWSLIHFINGYILYKIWGLNVILVMIIVVLFEAVEPYIKYAKREHKYDTLWDIIITMIGYYAAKGVFP